MVQVEHSPERIPESVRQALATADTYIFDVDGTLAERQAFVTQELATTLARTEKLLGIATSRALDELDEVFTGSGFSRAQLMQGPIVIEDGGLVIRPGSLVPDPLVPQEQAIAVRELMNCIKAAVTPVFGKDKWGQLADIKEPLVHIPHYYDYKVSGSVWQEVHDGVPRHLERTMEWVVNASEKLGVAHLVELSEIGDGTLRVAAPGRSKGVALTELETEGHINLSRTVYFGDGANDIPAARMLRDRGGCVIAVNSRCQELVGLSNYVTPIHGPLGIQSLIHSLKLSY
jgi:HAD superfamily hydrolase (TIGR01484 family)